MNVEAEIRANGWAAVEFGLRASEREEFAHASRDLLVLAEAEPDLAAGLSFTLEENLKVGTNNPTFYGVSGALNSGDKKIWIHGGYQTREMLQAQAPKFSKVPEVQSYLDGLDGVLPVLRNAFVQSLGAVSCQPENVEPIFFPQKLWDTIMLMRSVLYLELDKAQVGDEVIQGHGDMGFGSIQFFETNKNYLRAAAVARHMVGWEVTPEMVDYFKQTYERMNPVEYDRDTQAAFFLGCAVVGADNEAIGTGMPADLPICYHAGFYPGLEAPNTESDWMLSHERLTLVGFLHAPLPILRQAEIYRLPSLATCRPLKGVA